LIVFQQIYKHQQHLIEILIDDYRYQVRLVISNMFVFVDQIVQHQPYLVRHQILGMEFEIEYF
jgi:hypothetical protein